MSERGQGFIERGYGCDEKARNGKSERERERGSKGKRAKEKKKEKGKKRANKLKNNLINMKRLR